MKEKRGTSCTTHLHKLLGLVPAPEHAPPRRRGQSTKATSRPAPPPHQPRLASLLPDLPSAASPRPTGERSGAHLFAAAAATVDNEMPDGRKPSPTLSTCHRRDGEVPPPSRRRNGRRREEEPLDSQAESGGRRVASGFASCYSSRRRGKRERKLARSSPRRFTNSTHARHASGRSHHPSSSCQFGSCFSRTKAVENKSSHLVAIDPTHQVL